MVGGDSLGEWLMLLEPTLVGHGSYYHGHNGCMKIKAGDGGVGLASIEIAFFLVGKQTNEKRRRSISNPKRNGRIRST
ncbi:hypothetical protein BLOT_014617 [Blomia tropicalis]|nr:hypothetical protein BLOT_014617 [Blomia tropicalis]